MDNFYLMKSFEIPKYTSVLEKSIVLDKMLFRMEVKMSNFSSLSYGSYLYMKCIQEKKNYTTC